MGIFKLNWRRSQTPLDALLTGQANMQMAKTPEQLWREQPHLRTVVSFLGRNVAQLGLHAFRRDGDDSRVRLRDHPLASMLAKPNEHQTLPELLQALVCNLALYDHAYLRMLDDGAGGITLQTIPNSWVVDTFDSTPWAVGGYVLQPDSASAKTIRVPAKDMLEFHGWNPDDLRLGCSPVEALRGTLSEQIHAQAFREQLWQRGGRVGSYLTRPADAPKWSNEGRNRFRRMWGSAWTGNEGSNAGGTPLLEDGIQLHRVGFSAREEQFVEATKLALETVAGVYHVNPTMLGQLENANYSNVREFRSMLYGDTLGPILTIIAARINAFLVPRFEDSEGCYVEFNLSEKLRGSFEEQTAVLSSATGGPWMTPNEARAKQNLPAIEGGDVLLRPLNVAGAGDAPVTQDDATLAA